MIIATITINVCNLVDEILAERGFIERKQIRSIILDNLLAESHSYMSCEISHAGK
ncbi:MAG: hypothetical protein RM338_26705 [Nostoc sp. DedQUE12a]|nr:hypothetical protein [Nostoc sp. DedQUE12a]